MLLRWDTGPQGGVPSSLASPQDHERHPGSPGVMPPQALSAPRSDVGAFWHLTAQPLRFVPQRATESPPPKGSQRLNIGLERTRAPTLNLHV